MRFFFFFRSRSRFLVFLGAPTYPFFCSFSFLTPLGALRFTLRGQLSDSGSGSARQRMRLLGCLLCGNEVWVFVRRRKGEVVREWSGVRCGDWWSRRELQGQWH